MSKTVAVAHAEFLQAVAHLWPEAKPDPSKGRLWGDPAVRVYIFVIVTSWRNRERGWDPSHAARCQNEYPDKVVRTMGLLTPVGRRPGRRSNG